MSNYIPGISYIRFLSAVAALVLFFSGITPSPASADIDSDVKQVFMNGVVRTAEATPDRTLARTSGLGPQYYDPTLALLFTVRNWDSVTQDTRDELSRYIEISPWKNGSRTVQSVYSDGCPDVISEATDLTRDSAHFKAVYTDSGQHAATSDYVDNMLAMAEFVWNYEVTGMGLPAPRLPSDQKLRVYICDLVGATSILGRTWTTTTYSDYSADSFIEMDNDYNGVSIPSGTTLDEYVGVVFAHEFFHSIQFGINYYSPSYWIMEANATWIEDEVYPDNNDYLISYVGNRFDNIDVSIDHFGFSDLFAYGASIFFRYITERVVNGDSPQDFIVELWQEIDTQCADLSETWCRDIVTETPLINALLEDEGTDIYTVYRDFNVANYTKDYEDGDLSIFPDMDTTSVGISTGSASKSGNLDHLAAKFYSIPCTSCSTMNKLEIAFDGTETTDWAVTVIEERTSGKTTRHLSLTAGEGSLEINSFGLVVSSAVVIVNNVSLTADAKAYTLNITQTPDNTETASTSIPAGWNIIGLPLDPVGATPSDAFNNSDLIFFEYKDNEYVFEDNMSQPAAGMGYWVYMDQQTAVTLTGVPHDTGQISLVEGWNIVSLPSKNSADWDASVQVTDGTSTYTIGTTEADALVESSIYVYDDSQDEPMIKYALTDEYTIDPWVGFIIRASSACTLVFP